MQKKLQKKIKRYKRMVGCTTEQATIAIQYKEYEKISIRKAIICPTCGESSLAMTSDGAEYPTCWVECSNCDFTDDVDNYEPLQCWYHFDELPEMYANLKEYGFTKKEWKKYLRASIEEKRTELSAAGYLR